MPETSPNDPRPLGDPWQAFGYLTAGVFFYGLVGWLLDRWLGTSYLVVVGILVGAALGMFLIWKRIQLPKDEPPPTDKT